MIIPITPPKVRYSIHTSTLSGNVTIDFDVQKMIKDSFSNELELNIFYSDSSNCVSNVYHINKTYNTITFFFMVSNHLYYAALSGNKCTFGALDVGVSEATVQNMINNATNNLLSSGLAANMTDIDGEEGVTLTVPSTDVISGLFAEGRLILVDDVGNRYYSDFGYSVMNGFTLTQPGQSSVFTFTSESEGGYNTGTFITCSTGTFAAYVLWYFNPDGCYLAMGEFTPAD